MENIYYIWSKWEYEATISFAKFMKFKYSEEIPVPNKLR